LKRRSNTKKPHDPFVLYLDEDVSGRTFASLLSRARIEVCEYDSLLKKNTKTPDSKVIEVCSAASFILVTTDKRMESDWTDDIVRHKARIILLNFDEGGPLQWASALICKQSAWERVLLDHLAGPLVVKINRSGSVTKVVGSDELVKRRERILTGQVIRNKKRGRGFPG